METEKIYQEKTARTIRQKQEGGGMLQFVDNRPANPLLQRMDEDEEDTLQGKFGQSVQKNDVRVHYNSDKPATVQALAYTQGTDIHVAPGQEQHLPHEAWHVAQQMAGRVEPTTEVGGLPVNDSKELEHEADVMGAKANSY